MGEISKGMVKDRRPVTQLKSPDALEGGSGTCNLEDGSRKSPDYSYYDPNGAAHRTRDYEGAFPTVVFEVGFTEKSRKLGRDCARWLGASGGVVNLGIAIDIDAGTPEARILDTVSVTLWRCVSYVSSTTCPVNTILGSIQRFDRLPDKSPSQLSYKYTFSKKFGKRYMTWTIVGAPTKVSWRIGLSLTTQEYLTFLQQLFRFIL